LQRAGGKNKAYLPWSGRVFSGSSEAKPAQAAVAAFETTSSISFSTTAPLFSSALRYPLSFILLFLVFFLGAHNQLKRHLQQEKTATGIARYTAKNIN